MSTNQTSTHEVAQNSRLTANEVEAKVWRSVAKSALGDVEAQTAFDTVLQNLESDTLEANDELEVSSGVFE